MYEPPVKEELPSFAPTELDNQAEAFIADLAKDFTAEDEAPAQSQPVVEAPEIPGETPNTVEDPTERGLERLVAREVDLREREAKLSNASEEIKALRARLSELEPRSISPELLDKIKLSPQDGLRALGLDPDEVVRNALMEKLGDKANTPEMKDMMERVRLRKEMDTLRSKVQAAEQKQAAQAYYAQVADGAKKYVSAPEGLSKHAPTLSQVAKSNPDRVYSEIMEEITRDAAHRAQSEPNGDVITYQEAAARIEKRWSAMKALLVGENPSSATAPASINEPKTTVSAAQSPKIPPVTTKPPDRPLAPWLVAKKDEDEAILEAINEWKKAEAQRR